MTTRFVSAVGGLITLGLMTPMTIAEPTGHVRPTNLRCEYLRDPLAVDEPAPRLTWVVESDRRGEIQSAYRILVASTPEKLAADEGDLWDSGKVASRETANVPYDGHALAARQACHWKVMAWDRDGAPGAWSEPAVWELGLLAPSDLTAEWIEAGATPADIEILRATYYSTDGKVRKDVAEIVKDIVARGETVFANNKALGGDPAIDIPKRLEIEYRCDDHTLRTDVAERYAAVFAHGALPYLRKSFAVGMPIRKARLYATALGAYELYLNGERVGDACLAPGWTDYRKRVNYRAYDVTEQLADGKNVLGAIVAPGWFSGRAGLFHAKQFYGQAPALLAQLEITYADGSTERINSDTSWRRHDGPTLLADLMDGEIYDAAAAIDDWCSPDLDDIGWSPVAVRGESRNLRAAVDAPVRIVAELSALSVSEPTPGRWTFDLGQNMVGVVRLDVQAEAGTVLTIRHAEMLNADGTIYTTNLRGAAATDTYICKGDGSETWQPKFTFHGFRYVEITGLPEGSEPDIAVTGMAMTSDLPRVGEFSCSDGRLNKLHSNIVWGMRGNYVSIPTDCPQRDERMGWMADTQVFLPTAAYNAEIAAFMTKWMLDVTDSQREDGAYSDVSPVMKGLSFGTPAWADAGTITPWVLYQTYGDKRILERNIDSMIRWVEWCRTHSTDLIRDRDRGNDYGDWLSIDADTPKDLIGTAYFAHSSDIVANSLKAIGRDTDAKKYEQLFEQICAAFNARYVEPDGRIFGDTQTAYVLALRFNLLPEARRDEALRRLVADIEKRGDRLTTGFIGVGMLLPTLTDAGRPDVAYKLLVQDAFPSWLFSVKHGATTIWERWNGWTPETGYSDPGMNSFNHYALGSCGEWLFSGVGGIVLDPDHPGFEHFIIRPQLDGPLTWANTRYNSTRGEIATRWRLDGDQMALNVTIPANTTATVYIPARDGTEVTESGKPLDAIDGVKRLRREAAAAVLDVGSGTYKFQSQCPGMR